MLLFVIIWWALAILLYSRLQNLRRQGLPLRPGLVASIFLVGATLLVIIVVSLNPILNPQATLDSLGVLLEIIDLIVLFPLPIIAYFVIDRFFQKKLSTTTVRKPMVAMSTRWDQILFYFIIIGFPILMVFYVLYALGGG
jgi:hypothetical protein